MEADWMDRGVCVEMVKDGSLNPRLFFPEDSGTAGLELLEYERVAKTVCAVCPVTEDCAVYAANIDFGIFGGMNADERRRWARRRRRQKPQQELFTVGV